MAKQLTFTYQDVDYTLEFNRATVRRMERNGFDASAAEASPMSAIYDLFAGAFQAHHRNVDSKKITDIFNHIGDIGEWAEDLLEMYKEPFETLADGDKEGEIKRTKNW